MALGPSAPIAHNRGMSDTVSLAAITAIVTIAAAIIAHLDRHHLAGRAQLRDELVAQELVTAAAPTPA